MKPILTSTKFLVKKSPIHGYGVFAEVDINPGDIIEECHTIALKTPLKEVELKLRNYYFSWNDFLLLPFGNGCIYNHADEPNAVYAYDPEHQIITYQAKEFIKQGQEIFVNYGDNWFKMRRIKEKNPSLRFKIRRFLFSLFPLLRFTFVASIAFAFIILMKHLSF